MRTRPVLGVLALATAVPAIVLAALPVPGEPGIAATSPGTHFGAAAPSGSTPAQIDSLVSVIEGASAFRANRTPARLAYDPAATVAGPAAPAPSLPRPALMLSGVAGGRRPVAVISGLPGKSRPVLMARGDTSAGLRVVSITQREVVVMGFDTTWTLQLGGAR